MSALEGSYGLDYHSLAEVANPEGRTAVEREAASEISTLRHIKTYLETTRPAIRINGNSATVTLRKIPTRLLEAERRRMRVPHRGGNVNRRNYTNPEKPEMYRCGIPGWGGAVP